jgi:hypothetical protein
MSERAHATYGVVLADDDSVDEPATAALRAELKGGGSSLVPSAPSGDPVLHLIAQGERLWATGGRPHGLLRAIR